MKFEVGRGGVDVAKQVGAGNAPVGGIVADGPILVRGNGVPVKIVCVFGGRGFMQMVVRDDSGIKKPADLKGKTIYRHVISGHDLLRAAGSAGECRADAERREYPGGRARPASGNSSPLESRRHGWRS